MIRECMSTTLYRGYWIHTHYEREPGQIFGREVVRVQDPETLARIEVKSYRAAQIYITRYITRRTNAQSTADSMGPSSREP